MKLVGVVRPSATVTVEGIGSGVEELRAAVLDQQPADHELAQLLVGSGRVNGNLTGTGIFRATLTTAIEATGRDYVNARAELDALVPPAHQILSVRTVE